ncbi:efflux RND transporter periplasmic adaptor subunit [uncultured Sphingomonas sp.]|uniref:efflux RND transporter periplasmic adaptor subunit n=1 Tax=uncultured Sphingomonas sp. TaxID=158754 RepID=UPI0025DCE8F8|nr:efflux RND transporter periplasmic adaptor subunit [uncultured Sphingomonas sp.]
MTAFHTRPLHVGLLAAALLTSACGKKEAPPPPPKQVGVVTVQTEPVTLTTELPGRTSPFESSEVRPQVDGIITARLFKEGDFVRAGQTLYQIDPAPYAAQAANARAALARAQASIASTQALARRYGDLVKINAISRQDYENAVAGSNQAQADVAAQRAALSAANINLRRTRIAAPISGRIGTSTFTVGALVTAAQTQPLTVIQRLDPIYVDITQSSTDVLKLRRQLLAGDLSRSGGAARVRLKLEDGSDYGVEGRLQFTDVTVAPDTGSVTIRAIFPNKQSLLLPGMYVRADLVEGTQAQGILAPQQAVTRNEKGDPVAMVVGAGDKLEQRDLTAPRTVGDKWLVTGGLKPGDRLVMDGAGMLQPGTPVKPVPWTPARQNGPAPAQQGPQTSQPAGQQGPVGGGPDRTGSARDTNPTR